MKSPYNHKIIWCIVDKQGIFKKMTVYLTEAKWVYLLPTVAMNLITLSKNKQGGDTCIH